jgi:hypothetical protein
MTLNLQKNVQAAMVVQIQNKIYHVVKNFIIGYTNYMELFLTTSHMMKYKLNLEGTYYEMFSM